MSHTVFRRIWKTGAGVGAMSQAEPLELQTRAFSFGQDTSKLYASVGDDEGKKRWRVEFAATENEKEDAAVAILDFKQTFPLQELKLSNIYEQHVAHLERLVAEGAPQHRPWYVRRLAHRRASRRSWTFAFGFALWSDECVQYFALRRDATSGLT